MGITLFLLITLFDYPLGSILGCLVVNFPSEEDFLFKKCIKIQVFFFPLGYDVIAQAQSGTGKTATFAISILQQLDIEQKETQALVLAPTRELAQQVCKSYVTHLLTIQKTVDYCSNNSGVAN